VYVEYGNVGGIADIPEKETCLLGAKACYLGRQAASHFTHVSHIAQ